MDDTPAETSLLKLSRLSLVAVVALNLTVVSIRLMNGLPLGVDSTSHLFRVMLMSKSYQENGYVPQWNPDWYGGTTLFVFYPPLSHYVTFILSVVGLGPILAYKLVESVFYALGLLAVYLLVRHSGAGKTTTILAVLFYSFSPTILENYLFYDRFSSIVSLPLVCFFVMTLSQALANRRCQMFLILSGMLLGTIILVHHLSALCAALFGVVLVAAKAFTNPKGSNIKHFAVVLATVFLMGFLLSAFWAVPFIAASNQLLGNPFYNRNVEFPFIRLSYFSTNVATYAFGLAHLALSLFALRKDSYDSRARKRIVPISITSMLIGMALFELGEKAVVGPIATIGQGIVVLSLLSLFCAVWQGGKANPTEGSGLYFLKIAFVVFLWLSLGSFALPFVVIPPILYLWRALDVHRFWLYLSLPMSILSAMGFKQLFGSRASPPKNRTRLFAIFLIGIAVTGGCVKVIYTTTHNVSEFLPFGTVNRNIPAELIDYFRSDSTYARILAVRCPLWIYVLPYYTGKPLIDGWYPQEKLLKDILEINDYRILDLECAGSLENRTKTWRSLISKSRLLGIKWVLVGEVPLEARLSLFNGTHFNLHAEFQHEEGMISVYRSSEDIGMVELFSPGGGSATLSREGPDRLMVKLANIPDSSRIVIKEAYYPTWAAVSGDTTLEIGKDTEGFIQIKVPSGVQEIKLYHKSADPAAYYVSLATLMVLLLLLGSCLVDEKIFGRRRRG